MPHLLGIFQDDELIDACGIDSQLQASRLGIRDKPRFVSRINPRSGDDFRTVSRRTRFLVFDLTPDIVLGEQALFEQQFANGVNPSGNSA
jgi:hypothetical protein